MKYLVLILPFFLFAITDFGVRGKLHTIQEEDGIELLNKSIEDINYTKLRQEAINSTKNFLTVNLVIPPCTKSRSKNITPGIIVENDILDPLNGKIIYKKGYKYNFLRYDKKYKNKKLLFGTSQEIKKLNIKKINPDVIFLTNGYIKDIEKYGVIINKMDRKSIQSFKLNCTPSLYTPKVTRYNVKEIKVR